MPGDTAKHIASRMTQRRKEHGLTQTELAKLSGVNLASLRRFEQHYEISLASLIAIGYALGCETDFDALFSTPYYPTIEAVEQAAERQTR